MALPSTSLFLSTFARRGVGGVLISALLIAPSLVRAETPSSSTAITPASPAPALTKGLTAFHDLDYQRAQPLLEACLADPTVSSQDRAQAALHLGVIAITQSQETRAQTLFLQALELDRDLHLSEDDSPKVRAIFDEVRARMPAKEPAPAANAISPTPAPTDPQPLATVTTPTPSTPGDSTGHTAAQDSDADDVQQGWPWWFWAGGATAVVVAGSAIGVGLYLALNPSTDPDDNKTPVPPAGCQAPDGQGCVVVGF